MDSIPPLHRNTRRKNVGALIKFGGTQYDRRSAICKKYAVTAEFYFNFKRQNISSPLYFGWGGLISFNTCHPSKLFGIINIMNRKKAKIRPCEQHERSF